MQVSAFNYILQKLCLTVKFQSIFYGFSNCSMLAGIMDYFGAVILELDTIRNDIF